MKKLSFLILLFSILYVPEIARGQNFTWNPSFDLSTRTVTYAPRRTVTIPDSLAAYSVQFGEFGRERNLAGYQYSVTIWSVNLADTITCNLGSSNHRIPGTARYAFQGYPHDSLPYTWIESAHEVIDTRYDATLDTVYVDTLNIHNVNNNDQWLFDDFIWQISGIRDTVGVIGIDVNFIKP